MRETKHFEKEKPKKKPVEKIDTLLEKILPSLSRETRKEIERELKSIEDNLKSFETEKNDQMVEHENKRKETLQSQPLEYYSQQLAREKETLEFLQSDRNTETPEDKIRTTQNFTEHVQNTETIINELKTSMEGLEKDSESEILKVIKDLSKEERQAISLNIFKNGHEIEKRKSDFFVRNLDKLSKLKNLDTEGTVARSLRALRDSFKTDAEMADKKIKAGPNASALTKLSSVAYLAKNIIRPARILASAFGLPVHAGGTLIMGAGMLSARVTGAAKEARLSNQELLHQTRIGRNFTQKDEALTEQDIKDAEKAEEEAWKIYETAQKKAGNTVDEHGNVTVNELKTAYLQEIPKDLQERLREPHTAQNFTQRLLRKDMEWAIKKINKKIQNIDGDYTITQGKKEAKKEQLLRQWEKRLADYDRILTQTGTVDQWASMWRSGEFASKAVVRFWTLESLYELWSNIGSGGDEADQIKSPTITSTPTAIDTPRPTATPLINGTPESTTSFTPSATPEAITTPTPDPTPSPTQETQSSPDSSENITPAETETATNYKDAIVQEDEGIEHALIRQIKNDPELAKALAKYINFEGDLSKERVLKEFAGRAAHKVALERGYVDKITGDEIHVRPAGQIAYKLTLSGDSNDPFKVEEFKKINGEFVSQESHGNEKEFEGDKKEEYEYRQTKQPKVEVNIPETPTAGAEQNSFTKYIGKNQPEFGKGAFREGVFADKIKSLGEMENIENTQSPEITEELKKLGLDPKNRDAVDEFFNSHKNTPKTVEEIREEAVSKYEAPIIPAEPIQMPKASELYPEFQKDTFGLGVKKLLEVQDIYTTYVQKLSPQVNNGWNSIKNIAAHDVFKSRGGFSEKSPIMGPAYVYLNKLQLLTELKPKGNWLFGREKVSEYVSRALQYAATKDGMLEKLKIRN